MQYIIICLSETYISHDTLSDNDNLKIPGYELVRVDQPSNQTRGGICIYHKDILPIKVNKLFEGMFKFQSECIWETA